MKTRFKELTAMTAIAAILSATGPAMAFSPNKGPQIRPQVVRPVIKPIARLPAVSRQARPLHGDGLRGLGRQIVGSPVAQPQHCEPARSRRRTVYCRPYWMKRGFRPAELYGLGVR